MDIFKYLYDCFFSDFIEDDLYINSNSNTDINFNININSDTDTNINTNSWLFDSVDFSNSVIEIGSIENVVSVKLLDPNDIFNFLKKKQITWIECHPVLIPKHTTSKQIASKQIVSKLKASRRMIQFSNENSWLFFDIHDTPDKVSLASRYFVYG